MLSKNTFDNRNVSFANNDASMTKIGFTSRIDSPTNESNKRVRKIKKDDCKDFGKDGLQRSRSRIRGALKRNLDSTFAPEGFIIDPDKEALIRRQFEDNRAAYELKIE